MKNVVSFQAFHMAKNYPAISAVVEYWTSLAQNGDIPRRGDIHPRQLGDSLPYIFLLDRVGVDRANFRICGTYLTTLFGEDAKGRPFEELFAVQTYPHLHHVVQRIWDSAVPTIFNVGAENQFGTDEKLGGKIALLPLRDAFGERSKAIGVIQTDGRIKYPPYSFDIKSQSDDIFAKNTSDAYKVLSNKPKGRLSFWS